MMSIQTNTCFLCRLVHDWPVKYSMYVRVLFGTVINESSVIFRSKKDLREMIDPYFGLPELLMEREVLTDDDRQTVKSNPSLQKCNDELIHLVLLKGDTAERQFIGCLPETDQHHVWHFVNCDGGNHCAI